MFNEKQPQPISINVNTVEMLNTEQARKFLNLDVGELEQSRETGRLLGAYAPKFIASRDSSKRVWYTNLALIEFILSLEQFRGVDPAYETLYTGERHYIENDTPRTVPFILEK